MASTDIHVPDLGNFKDVAIIDVLVKPGDKVDVDTPLLTLETDKATMDVPSVAAGVIEKLHVKKGDRVSTGSLIATLQAAAEAAAAAKPAAGAAPAAAAAPAPVATPAAPAAASQDVHVPDLGNFKDVAIIDVLVKPGDKVEVDTPLLTLETDKATMDVPSVAAGVVEKLHVKKGERVSAGSLIATLKGAAAALPAAASAPAAAAAPAKAAAAPAPAAAPVAAKAAAPLAVLPAVPADQSKAHAGPSVRQLARELGVDLTRVSGSGVKGRITHDDVKAWVKQALGGGGVAAAGGGALPRVPVVDFAQFGAIEVQPLSRIQKISGARLHASWVNLPHVTQYDEADITDIEEARKWVKHRAAAEGLKLTPLAFVIRAVVKTLQKFPRFNSSLDASGENLVLKKYIHIGFAADTPNGLVVPVIRDADRMDLFQITRALGELSDKARKGKLGGADMQGGTFTVSSLGGIGGTAFTPIINAPEVAILGVSKSAFRPVWKDNAFVPRLMLPLSLSYDHRVIDGADGARFSTALTQALADAGALLEGVA
ncbi:MAG: dihydrolipoyllysine-residue acetyltransferase [Steroidobacteraceae bacterium]